MTMETLSREENGNQLSGLIVNDQAITRYLIFNSYILVVLTYMYISCLRSASGDLAF